MSDIKNGVGNKEAQNYHFKRSGQPAKAPDAQKFYPNTGRQIFFLLFFNKKIPGVSFLFQQNEVEAVVKTTLKWLTTFKYGDICPIFILKFIPTTKQFFNKSVFLFFTVHIKWRTFVSSITNNDGAAKKTGIMDTQF